MLERQDVHPASALLSAGVKLTVGTDDPVQCDTNLPREYDLLRAYLLADRILATSVESVVRRVKEIAAGRVKGNILVDSSLR